VDNILMRVADGPAEFPPSRLVGFPVRLTSLSLSRQRRLLS